MKATEVYRMIDPFVQRRIDELLAQSRANDGSDYSDFTILLYDVSSDAMKKYSLSSTGFSAALAASASGDVITIPPVTITGNHTMIAGVKIVGLSRFGTIFTGQITGASGASIENLSITRTANDGSNLIGINGQSTGIFYVHACHITVTQSGAGQARGISQAAAGAIQIWSSYIYGNSVGGSGYGSYRTAGAIVIDGGACLGSTAAIYDP